MNPTMPRVAPRGATRQPLPTRTKQLRIEALRQPATLTLPTLACGLVVCAQVGEAEPPSDAPAMPGHPSPQDRLRELARVLGQHRLATLVVDLLDEDEADEVEHAAGAVNATVRGEGGVRTGDPARHLSLLTERAVATLDWTASHDELAGLRAGLCGAGVVAAAALIAATRRPARVAAVVGRSGRPDLAGAALSRVAVPTLLIVGGNDPEAMAFNRAAMLSLSCEKRLEAVPGATHDFDEPGALEAMAHLAGAWLAERLGGGSERR